MKPDYKEEENFTEGSFQKALEEIVRKVISQEVRPLKESLDKLIVEKEYTVQEVAAILDVSHITVRSWMKKNLMAYKKIGGNYRITHTQLEDFIAVQERKKPRFTKNRKHNKI